MIKLQMRASAILLAALAGVTLPASPAFAQKTAERPAPGATQDSAQRAPEIATGYEEKAGWAARKYMVAAANPLAVEAGYEMLKKGGSAIDAAIATQMVLTLVEPQSSGIGGGAFLVHYDGKKTQAFDGRETAPMAADEHLFEKPDGTPAWSADGRSARRACCACWSWPTSSTASCPGSPCSARRSACPNAASRSARA